MPMYKYFNADLNQLSPVLGDEKRVEKRLKDGSSVVDYEPVDYKELAKTRGNVSDWSLNALFRAGINPGAINIHTGYNTRLEGASEIDAVAAEVDAALAPKDETSNSKN